MKTIPTIAGSLAFLLTSLVGQDQASTLARLTDSADVVCKVRVLAVTGRDSARLAVVFRGTAPLVGRVPDTFQLTESGYRTCGRVLYGMVPGTTYFVFLDRKGGEISLAVAAARCLIPVTPGIEAHLLALSRSRTGSSRIAILASALDAPQQRIREDAALALVTTPYLADADATARAQFIRGLRVAVATESRTAPSLMVAAARLRLTEALDTLLPAYLEGHSPRLERAMLNTIPQIDSRAAAARIAAQLPTSQPGRVRAIQILNRLPASMTEPAYVALLRGSSFDLTVTAGNNLLRAGMTPAELTQLTNKEVAKASASQRILTRPRFRAVIQGEAVR